MAKSKRAGERPAERVIESLREVRAWLRGEVALRVREAGPVVKREVPDGRG